MIITINMIEEDRINHNDQESGSTHPLVEKKKGNGSILQSKKPVNIFIVPCFISQVSDDFFVFL